ncbi:methylmalonyl-CoA mutase family protein [Nonomuraea sp. NPDC055795]
MELAAGYPPVTRDDWHAMALAVLGKSGLDFEALTSRTYDGLTLQPLYDAADLPGTPRPPLGARGWDVRQRHSAADPEAVLADLENGVTSLWLDVGPDAIPVAALPRVLKDVYLDLAPVVLDAGPLAEQAAEVLLGLAAGRQGPVRGNLGASLASVPPRVVAALARRCAQGYPELRAVVVDAMPYHDMGGSDAQELGCSLALGVAHLRTLTGAGLSVEEAFGQLEFRYAASADQFATIAKLRAARVVWARVAEVCGGPARQAQHAVTSAAMMTARDPWVNMLRTTLACFGAGVGGADAVTVRPFDAAVREPDAFGRRIARNTHALLMEESGAARVADPAGGSWYVERRTAELAEAAWTWFQEIEAAGGLPDGAGELVAGRIAQMGTVPEAPREVVDAAVAAAGAALAGPWGATSTEERCAWMRRIADGIEARFDAFVAAEVADTGKPRELAATVDVPRAIGNFRAYADLSYGRPERAYHTRVPGWSGTGEALNYTVRRPLGVVAVISPWNLPLLLLTWKVAPALAAGNAVVAKPSEETPSTATLLAEVIDEVRLPPGAFNLIPAESNGLLSSPVDR